MRKTGVFNFCFQIQLVCRYGLGEVWKFMRSDTIGRVEDTELILVECNATVGPWAAAAANPKLHTSLAPNTIPAGGCTSHDNAQFTRPVA
jgi:hypothetical protein